MRGSVTRLIFNKRGDVKHLKDWRSISLLNVDYKIISIAIALHLPKVLEHIVHPDQTCSVPGQTDESAILISLDQEKAFERVNCPFLLKLLHVYIFRPVFVDGFLPFTTSHSYKSF